MRGCIWTKNSGTHWEPLGNLPLIPVYDLATDTISRRLVAGTFARSLWSFPLDSMLTTAPVTPGNGLNTFTNFDFGALPNPFNNTLEITAGRAVEQVTVFTLSGQVILTLKPEEKQVLSTSHWNPGTYIMQWTSVNGGKQTQLVLKQ